jgi:hypothetical protein
MSLPWIRVYNDLPDHPKSDHLAALLDEPRAWTHVLELWLWVSRVRPDGSLAGLHPVVIAKRAGWDGDPVTFVDAMRQAGFIDGDQVHAWEEYQGAHAKKLEKDRTRIRQLRDKNKCVAATLPATVSATVVATLPASVVGNVPPLDESRGEEKIKNNNLALFENRKDAAPVEDKPRRGRPPKDRSPEAEAERLAEKADGDRWMDAARKLTGLTADELRWNTGAFMAFRKQRKARGMDQLMRALEGLEKDAFSKTAGLGWLVSDNGITKGLAKWAKGATTTHVSRVQHAVGTGDAFMRSMWGEE